jgi:zinc/manganese transport system permease protein
MLNLWEQIFHHWHWLLPPFAAGVLVVLTHVVFGQEVLKRGIIFIDLTIAQMAALGVIIAVLLGADGGWLVQACAVGAALVAAAGLAWTEKRFADRQEAIIGSLYVVAASMVLLLLSKDPHAGEQINRLLSGQILWLGWADIWPVVLLYGAVLALWFLSGQRGFYLLFSLVVTSSVQMIGLYLVFATLVLPSLASRRLLAAWMIGLLGYGLGFAASVSADLPAGPAIVVALAVVGLGYNVIFMRTRA